MIKPQAQRQAAGLPKVVVVLGPTATGKSDLAVEIARAFRGEVISADSRQVYRGLDIGAGKITKREMKGVPHHLLDVASPAGRRYTVEDFKRGGVRVIRETLERGNLPIVCGGTGFYIDALIYDESFPAVRPDQKLRRTLAKKTPKALMRTLMKLDPRRAREMDPRNKVRIIRAIEIARALGSVPRTKRTRRYDVLWIGITADRSRIRERIHARLVRRMKGDRIIRETVALQREGVSWKRLYEFGLEYRYAALYLQKKITKDAMLAELEQRIVDFSKRQMTWFKKNKGIAWIGIKESAKAKRLVRSFLSS